MQNCKKCGASWNANRAFDMCPFCGADLKGKVVVNSIEAAFRIVLEQHGQDVFQSEILLGLLGDYAPSLEKERKLVKIAVKSGAYKAICNASISEREHIANRYVALLTDSYFIDKTWARSVLSWCIDALATDSILEVPPTKQSSENQITVSSNGCTEGILLQRLQSEKEKASDDSNFVIKDGVLKEYKGTENSIALPATVRTIGTSAFYSNSRIRKIIVPDSVRVIEKNAFAYCENLESISIPESITEIGEMAFTNCKNLKQISLPNSVTKVDRFAFQGCSALTTVRLSDEIIEIQEGTFYNCKSLANITFPRKLKVIKNIAFKDCKSLENILLPSELETIEDQAFSCCWGIKKIIVTSNLKIDATKFDRLYNSDEVEIKYMRDAESLNSSSNGFLRISCIDDIPKRLDRARKWENVTSVVVEEGIEELPMEVFAWMENLQRVTLPRSLKKIGFGAFRNCSKLNNVVIPIFVTTISAHAFENCGCLKSISIPDSVKYIGDDAFLKCPFQTIYVNAKCIICNGNYQVKNKG